MQISWTLSDLVWGLALSLLVFLYVETPCRYLFKHVTTPSSKHRKSNIISNMITILFQMYILHCGNCAVYSVHPLRH